MVVKIHKDGHDGMGLLIGTANARRHFPKRAQTIDLRLDDLQIQLRLSPDFWDGPAQIHDSRLSEWLEFKVGRVPAGCEPMQLTMVLSGDGTYIIKPRAEETHDAFGIDLNLPRSVASESFLALRPEPALASR